MASLDWQEIDLPSYVKEAQPYIKQAIEDPEKVPSRFMDDVANTVVNRAIRDPGYYVIAGMICKTITEKEREQQMEFSIPKYTFRTGLVGAAQLFLQDWAEMRETNKEFWICYCRFIGEIYKTVRPAGESLRALSNIVLRILMQLASPACVNNFEEADLLCSLFHECGRDLKDDSPDMEEVVNAIRDSFLDSNTDKAIQGLLLPLIELHASNYELSQDAKNFYFQR